MAEDVRGPWTFRVRLVGEGIRPETVSIRQLSELLAELDRLFEEETEHDGVLPEEDGLTVSLVGVSEGSANLVFACNHRLQGAELFYRVTKALAGKHGEDVKRSKAKGLCEFSKRTNARIQFFPENDESPVVEINPGEEISEEVAVMEGETSIYGVLVRVGGVEPKARLRLNDGSALSVRVTEDFARKLGSLLYLKIGLRGRATWRLPDYSLIDFVAEELLDYAPTDFSQAFKELRNICPEAWAEVDDVAAAVRTIREGSLE